MHYVNNIKAAKSYLDKEAVGLKVTNVFACSNGSGGDQGLLTGSKNIHSSSSHCLPTMETHVQ